MESKSIQTKFVEAWSAIENPELDGINPHFKNRSTPWRTSPTRRLSEAR